MFNLAYLKKSNNLFGPPGTGTFSQVTAQINWQETTRMGTSISVLADLSPRAYLAIEFL